MIIKSYELEKIKKNSSNFYLLYGENEGYKNQVINDVLTINFKDNINRYEETDIINNFDNFVAQITNKSFFEEKKIIIISRVSEKIYKYFEDIIARNIDNTHIIFNAGILDKKSKLRSNFEKNKNLICIPFYSDDSNTLGKLANNFFREKKISISQETINLLVEKCKGDRENLKNEFSDVERTYIPMHSIIRIDEVKKQGSAKITSTSDKSENVMPFPIYTKPNSDVDSQ